MLGHDNLLANMDQMEPVPAMRIGQDDVVLLVLPVFHIYALNVILGMTIREGGTAVLVERFDPAETLDIVEQQGVTVLPGAPPMFVEWLDQPRGAEEGVRDRPDRGLRRRRRCRRRRSSGSRTGSASRSGRATASPRPGRPVTSNALGDGRGRVRSGCRSRASRSGWSRDATARTSRRATPARSW